MSLRVRLSLKHRALRDLELSPACGLLYHHDRASRHAGLSANYGEWSSGYANRIGTYGVPSGAFLGLGLSLLYFYRRPKASLERVFLGTLFAGFGAGLIA